MKTLQRMPVLMMSRYPCACCYLTVLGRVGILEEDKATPCQDDGWITEDSSGMYI